MKTKQVAGILALLFGVFGVHRFYLGKRFWGILHLFFFFICFVMTIEEQAPFIIAPALLGFIDAVLLFVMPKEEFDEKYNAKYLERNYDTSYRRPAIPAARPLPQALPAASPTHPERFFKKRGVEHFRRYNYEAAIDDFLEALDHFYEDPITHFNLACCYSRLEDTEESIHHLSEAVAFGFKDIKKIHTHASLAFLRSTPAFEAFVANGYQKLETVKPKMAPTPAREETPAAEAAPPEPVLNLNDNLLDQIVRLGELRDKGILTEEEFSAQKQKILNG